MTTRAETAAGNNAVWCDLLCRTHGAATRVGDGLWTSSVRTPPTYPDAVTLSSGVSITGLLDRVDASPGCSVKDSFACLDLTAHGFRPAFEAQWIVRHPGGAAPGALRTRWALVEDDDGLRRWEAAWSGDGSRPGIFRPELLGRPDVAVLATGSRGRVSAGAVLSRGAGVVGLSNLFAPAGDRAGALAGAVAAAGSRFPGAILVGYESGPDLLIARRLGFEPVGPLRVWANADPAPGAPAGTRATGRTRAVSSGRRSAGRT